MRLFLDSSALAKRYVLEAGSGEVLQLCSEADEVVLSTICSVEILSALNRRKREGKLSASRYRGLKRDFGEDLKGATIVELYPEVVRYAVKCLEKAPVRSLDAIHIASAIVSGADLFLSADQRQVTAARKMGLKASMIKG